MKASSIKSRALQFVLLIGVMSFFADFTYEGSRSIIGLITFSLVAELAAIPLFVVVSRKSAQ